MYLSFVLLFVLVGCCGTVSRPGRSPSCSLNEDGRAPEVDVLILEAGIAGVADARTLEVNGITDFLVLEAGDRLGGRIREEESTGLELGANWIHGLDMRDKAHHPIWREWSACDSDGPMVASLPLTSLRYTTAPVASMTFGTRVGRI